MQNKIDEAAVAPAVTTDMDESPPMTRKHLIESDPGSRGEQDGALDDDGAMFGSDDDGSQAVAVDSHAQSAQVRRFEQVRRLVQCDVDEVNAIPGISAGMWFPSVDAPKIHVWIAIDLEARYQLDPFRASAWMSDTSRRVVQRIDFAPGYTRDEMQPEVKKDKCGLTDVWNLNQRQLSLASPAQSAGMHHERDLESGGEIEGFGLQFVVNNAIKKSLVSHWPPPELNPREWERPEGARLHEEYRKVMEICRVSAPLAKRIYAYYKTRHGNIAGSTNEKPKLSNITPLSAPMIFSVGIVFGGPSPLLLPRATDSAKAAFTTSVSFVL
jgi:hypothetical protein